MPEAKCSECGTLYDFASQEAAAEPGRRCAGCYQARMRNMATADDPDVRAFPLRVVLSALQPYLYCDFRGLALLAEFTLGHPVWTHEFPEMMEKVRALIVAQHPQLAEFCHLNQRRPIADDPAAVLAAFEERYPALCARFGLTVTLRKGTELRTETPAESAQRVMPGADIIVVHKPGAIEEKEKTL